MHGGRAATPASLNDAAYLITVVTAALPGALAVWVLFALLIAWGARGPWAMACALGYGLASMALALCWSFGATLLATAVNPQTPLGIKQPFSDYLLPQWQADRIALAKQGIDMKWPRAEAPAASWNAGQRLGFDGRVSLAPLLVVQLMVGAWLFAAVMRTRAAVVPLVDLYARDT